MRASLLTHDFTHAHCPSSPLSPPTQCFSLDISKNNLCGPGKHPRNPTKGDFTVSVQIIGRDNRPYGAWKEEAEALAAKEDASESENESESDDDENQPLLGEGKEEKEGKEGKEGKKKKKLTKRQKRRLRYQADVQAMWERWDGVHSAPEPPIDGVEANLYGIFLLFKALKVIAGSACRHAFDVYENV